MVMMATEDESNPFSKAEECVETEDGYGCTVEDVEDLLVELADIKSKSQDSNTQEETQEVITKLEAYTQRLKKSLSFLPRY